jgi:hypothetical protein
MTKKMIFVFGIASFVFFFLWMNWILNDITLIFGVDMNANLSIETHVIYDKPFILTKK